MSEIVEAENGVFEAILSLIHQGDWHVPLPERILIFVDFGMTPESTVASAVPFFDADGWLRVKGRFAETPYAREIRARVESGEIETMQDQAIMSEYTDFCHILVSGSFITPQTERPCPMAIIGGPTP